MGTLKENLDTKIVISVKKDNGFSYKIHIWFCGIMSQEEINKIDDNVYYKEIIDKHFGENTYEIDEVLYTTSKIDSKEDYNVVIVDSALVPSDTTDSKAIMRVKRVDFNGDHIIKTFHIWFPDSQTEKQIEQSIFSYDIKNRINNFFGSSDYELVNVKYEQKNKHHNYYEIFIDDHVTIKRENIKKDTLRLDDMDLKELLNLKDRVEEVIFKKENNLTDEEYEFFLENEENIKIEDVKNMFRVYKKDEFKFKKIKIKEKIKSLYEINQ